MKIKLLTNKGYSFIEKWVTENSIYGKPNERNMEAWCQDAEAGRLEDDPIIEMSQFNTISGRTETLMIPEQYFTYELLEE
jgi:hypothetical protein